MELRQLEYFVAIVEHESFSLAAKKLYVSHSALSKTVKKLEEEFGTPLLFQSEKRTLPTSAGSVLYEQGRLLLDAAANTADIVSGAASSVRGYLRISSSCKMGYVPRLCRCVAAFSEAYPQVFIDLDESSPQQIREALIRRHIDLGIVVETGELTPASSFDALVLERGEYRVVLPADHPLAGRESLSLEELALENWGQMRETFYGFQLIADVCGAAGYRPKTVVATSQPELLFAMVSAGRCICLQPWPDKGALIHDWPNLTTAAIEGASSEFELRVLQLKGTYLSPVAQTFLQYLSEHFN